VLIHPSAELTGDPGKVLIDDRAGGFEVMGLGVADPVCGASKY